MELVERSFIEDLRNKWIKRYKFGGSVNWEAKELGAFYCVNPDGSYTAYDNRQGCGWMCEWNSLEAVKAYLEDRPFNECEIIDRAEVMKHAAI